MNYTDIPATSDHFLDPLKCAYFELRSIDPADTSLEDPTSVISCNIFTLNPDSCVLISDIFLIAYYYSTFSLQKTMWSVT
jgi:hypothetical protein